MSALDLVQTFIEYNFSMTRRVWESIAQLTDEQFLQDDHYSRGSIRNLMVHLASTDRRWLAGLKNDPEVGHLKFEDYPTISESRALFENIARDMRSYGTSLSEGELGEKPVNIPAFRAEVLLHLVNHGTDHRATVLQRLAAFGAPTFEQDFITWLWQRERGE